MAQDNRAFLKFCALTNDLLHKHDLKYLYVAVLKQQGTIESVREFHPNCFKIKVNYWEVAPKNNSNILKFLTTKDFILKPRKEYGQVS